MSRLDCERWASLLDREALEGALSRDDVAFQAEHALKCTACANELAAWRELGSLDVAQGPALERDLALEEGALKTLWSEPPAPRRLVARRRPLVAAAGVLIAAAAAFMLLSSRTEVPRAIEPLSRVTIGSGSALSEKGALRRLGEAVTAGERLRAGPTPVCLLVEPGIKACLSAGGELRLAESTLSLRRIELLRGRLVASLDPQPAGSSFSVSTRSARVTAVGTIFAVELSPTNEQVLVRVLKGSVKVRRGAEQERVLRAHQSLAFGADAPSDIPPSEEENDLNLLRSDATPGLSAAAETAPAETLDVTGSSPPSRSPQAVGSAPVASEPVSAGALLREALELRRKGRFAEAAQAYRRLLSQHAGSAEARAALVSLGDLQLSRLQQADAALSSFEAYLKSGDRALVQEAEYGRIRALRALGRAEEERRAIEQLLVRRPSGVHAESMRARLRSLQGNAPR